MLKLAMVPLLLVSLYCCTGHAEAARSKDQVTGSVLALPLAGRVTDAANLLTLEQETELSAKLEGFERSTGHQMVVATVPTLAGKDITAFTMELANSWGIGRKDYDDGVVFLIAPRERKAPIAVGYGLEKELPDAFCSQVMDEDILPHFRHGDFAGGIDAGVAAIIRKLNSSSSAP